MRRICQKPRKSGSSDHPYSCFECLRTILGTTKGGYAQRIRSVGVTVAIDRKEDGVVVEVTVATARAVLGGQIEEGSQIGLGCGVWENG